MQIVYGKNVVKQLLSSNKKIHELYIVEGFNDKEFDKYIREQKTIVKKMGKKKLDQITNEGNHQGIAAQIDDYKIYSMEELVNSAKDKTNPVFLMLDGLEDPHNLGAMLRTCDAIGVDGIIVGKHRSVGLTPTVAKVSTGAIDTVKVAQVTNLVKTIEYLKDKGFWVVGTDIDNSRNYTEGTYDVPLVVIIGNEGVGMSSLVKKNCDYCISLPMVGSVQSLNASVACGIIMYEIYNQRITKG